MSPSVRFIPARGYDWLVRAYDPATGALLWEDLTDYAGGDDFSRGPAIATDKDLLFLGGFATNLQGDSDVVVRAYDASSGAIVWQDQVDYGGPLGDAVTSLSAKAGRFLFVAGLAATAVTDGLFVRAYDARTGELLWQRSTTDTAPELFLFGGGAITVHANRVFVGASLGAGLPAIGFVQSFDVRTGALLWEDQIHKGGNFDIVQELDAHGGRLFVVGFGGTSCLDGASPPSNCDVFVRSYAAATGTLLWEREFDYSGVDDVAFGIKAGPANVYFTTSAGPLEFPVGGDPMGIWRVQALKASTGTLSWEHVGDTAFERALDLVLHRGQLFAVGRSTTTEFCCHFVVRASDTIPPGSAEGIDEDLHSKE